MARTQEKNLNYLELNAQVTLTLFSILSLCDFFIQLRHFIGRGFFALSRIQPFARNDGFTWRASHPVNSTFGPAPSRKSILILQDTHLDPPVHSASFLRHFVGKWLAAAECFCLNAIFSDAFGNKVFFHRLNARFG
jgi:hypothetical protein